MCFVGSYATSPNNWALENPKDGVPVDAGREAAFYAGLADIPDCSGLEVQCDMAGNLHAFDEESFLAKWAHPRWSAVITCIGGTMGNVGASAVFGLASTDDAGRRSALDFARLAQQAVGRWNARGDGSGGRVVAVAIHSAPNTTKEGSSASVEAFAASLQEMQSWDWQGAALVVEHCDSAEGARLRQHAASKGFLTMPEEVAAVKMALAASTNPQTAAPLGVSVNWARSVLETRDVTTPLEHLRLAREAGVLRGLIFSGCTDLAQENCP